MRTLLAVALCVLALGAAACSHDYSPPASATTPAPLTGEHTQLNPSPELKSAGVTVDAIAPGTKAAAGVVLPITGGTVSLDTLQGLIHQGGGLRYTGNGKTVDLTQIQINTAAKQLSANVDGASFMPVMDVQLATVNQTGDLVQADVTLTLSSAGAQALGLDGLQPGMTMGTGVIQAKAGQ
jgi:hypothetical protein